MRKDTLALWASAVILSAGAAIAAEQPPSDGEAKKAAEERAKNAAEARVNSTSVSAFKAPIPVPDSPAFAVLGIAPKNINRPSTPQEFGLAALNGVDPQGNLQSGLAITTVPFLLFSDVTLSDYRNLFIPRTLSRLSLSLATSKGGSDNDNSAKVGAGLNLVLFDGGDPRFDKAYERCVVSTVFEPAFAAFEATAQGTNEPLLDFLNRQEGTLNDVLRTKQPAYERCRAESGRRTWNYSAIEVGAGQAWLSADGKWNNLSPDTSAFYAAISLGFSERLEFRWNIANATTSVVPEDTWGGQLVLSAKYANNESIADPDNEGAFLKQDLTTVGSLLRYGSQSLLFYVDGSYAWGRRANVDINTSRIAVGAEIALSDGLWLDISAGANGGADKSGFVLSQFKFSLDHSGGQRRSDFARTIGVGQ